LSVLATDDKSEIVDSKSDQNTSTVTLLLEMEEARLVKLAEDVGKLHVGMRSKKEDQPKRAKESELFKPAEMLDFFNEEDDEGDEDDGSEEVETPEEPEPETVDLTTFLDGNLDEPATDPGPEQSKFTLNSNRLIPTTPQMWQMEIFSGDVLRVEEVPLPQALEVQTSGNPVIDSFRKMFGVKVRENPTTDSENLKDNLQAKDQQGSRPAQKPSDSPLFPSARASSLSEIRQR
jgi:hypothetical protein